MHLYGENLGVYKRIIARANAENVPVKLIIGPYFPKFRKHLDLSNYFEKIPKELGIDILDYSNAIQEQSAFADRIHLNRKGGIMLVDKLVRNQVFN